ncbi:hypothetical protein K458DRAFT_455332 [Lentithecium fluviatile CBS 122367]|uniref:Uncharacterized protein n=1 Tax=Lentithecium fluviatile CBS 122367 TaxID=1168545 RepID=A0A6G1JLE2_9PLEO|nr:hypothetical protein K458DRAFT_455332 [Lentithecium fluviatile CBS 122367]
MEHFAPHPKSVFEGYCSKFDLPSGAHVALIICSVPSATSLPPHMVSFTYYPRNGFPIFQREHWGPSIERIETSPDHVFELHILGMGSMAVDTDSTTTYDLKCKEWSLEGMTASHTPWREGKNTPEGWLVGLPLPLHWHVHSLCSPAAFRLEIPSIKLPRTNSFPSSHIWIQAHNADTNSGICLAGDKIMGMHAFILGYRSPSLSIDLLPPFALSCLGISPFMSTDIDYGNRAVSITVNNFWDRIQFGLGSPFLEGHMRNFCTESFLAVVEVEAFERRLWSWKEVKRERFEGASLEFAGGYFPERVEKEDRASSSRIQRTARELNEENEKARKEGFASSSGSADRSDTVSLGVSKPRDPKTVSKDKNNRESAPVRAS